MAFNSNAISLVLDPDERDELEEGAMLVTEAAKPFDPQSFLEGHMTPVFFGSALRHFGVAPLLDGIGAYAPPPKPVAATRDGEPTHVAPGDSEVSGFVFKVQANMDPNHRDRVAFLRLCSGAFTRGMKLKVQNTGRQISVNAPIMFFASDRELAEAAFAGDVIGIPNHGILRVGDSLSESGRLRFAGLPNFAPEILRRVRVTDPLKAKHLKKALESLAEEGVTQLFRPVIGSDFIVGAVGQLQFEVMADRLVGEYDLAVEFEPAPFAEAPLAGRRARRRRGLRRQASHRHGSGPRRPLGLPRQVSVGAQLRGRALPGRDVPEDTRARLGSGRRVLGDESEPGHREVMIEGIGETDPRSFHDREARCVHQGELVQVGAPQEVPRLFEVVKVARNDSQETRFVQGLLPSQRDVPVGVAIEEGECLDDHGNRRVKFGARLQQRLPLASRSAVKRVARQRQRDPCTAVDERRLALAH